MQQLKSIEAEIKANLSNWPKIIKEYKIPSTKRATIQLLNSILPFIGLWILMYFSLAWSYWITLGLALINSFFLVRIFIIQHDCGHNSFVKSKRWNNILGYACSCFSSLPYKYWAKVHNFHHGHTGQLEHRDIGDIDFLTVKEYKSLNRWGRIKYKIFRNPFVLFGVVPVYYFTIANRYPTINFKEWNNIGWNQLLNNLGVGLVYLTLALILGWKQFLLVHIPIVFFFSIIAFWFFYVQHQHDHTYMQWKDNWDYLIASMRGASYYKLPKIVQWMTGNIGYHHIHHLNAKIPNYNLVRCARENPILQKYANTVTFGQSLKFMFNKLWDEDSQRMITFREFKKRNKLK